MDENQTTAVQDSWIKIDENGLFICVECGNEGKPQIMTEEGLIDADLEDVKAQLTEFPTKIIYGVCAVCGMEYVFKLVETELYLEPSDEEK